MCARRKAPPRTFSFHIPWPCDLIHIAITFSALTASSATFVFALVSPSGVASLPYTQAAGSVAPIFYSIFGGSVNSFTRRHHPRCARGVHRPPFFNSITSCPLCGDRLHLPLTQRHFFYSSYGTPSCQVIRSRLPANPFTYRRRRPATFLFNISNPRGLRHPPMRAAATFLFKMWYPPGHFAHHRRSLPRLSLPQIDSLPAAAISELVGGA
jgi:hypothetical protein